MCLWVCVCVCPIHNTKMHPSPPPRFLPYMDTLTKPLTPIPRPLSTFIPTTSSSISTPDTPHTGCYRWEATGARWTIWNNYSRNDSREDSCARGREGSTLSLFFRGITIHLFTVIESSEELIVLVVGWKRTLLRFLFLLLFLCFSSHLQSVMHCVATTLPPP